MVTLKELVYDYSSVCSDMELIKKWFIENDAETEGLSLVCDLAQYKADKIQRKLHYAQSWIPSMCPLETLPELKDKPEIAKNLKAIITYQMLSLPLPESFVEWAKDNIPNMDIPQMFFLPTAKWLKEKYGIEFRNYSEFNFDIFDIE